MKRSDDGHELLFEDTGKPIRQGNQYWLIRRNRESGLIWPSYGWVDYLHIPDGFFYDHSGDTTRVITLTCAVDDHHVYQHPKSAAEAWLRMLEAQDGN